MVKDLKTTEGTRHCHLSDQEEPDAIPPQLAWRCCAELTPEMLVELVHTFMEKPEPQRISVGALQVFVGLYKEEEILKCVDSLLEAARGTVHVVSLCTLRYVPNAFIHWSVVDNVNKHIWKLHQEGGLPMLNLHRTFYARQGQAWVTSSHCYQDFMDGSNLGSVLSDVGICRYRSRIVNFHSNIDRSSAVVREVMSLAPLPLWQTFQYTENEVAAELLSSLGYELKTRSIVVRESRAVKRQLKKAAKEAVPVAVPVDRKESDVAQAQAAEVGVDQGRPSGGKQRGRRQERGRKRARSWDTERVSVTRPYSYQLMQIDSSTFRSMIIQIGDLKEALKVANKKVEDMEDKLRHRDNSVVKLTGLKEKLQSEVSITARSERAMEFRCKEAERYIAKQAERHYSDIEEWKEAQTEWRREKRELELKLERSEEQVRANGLKMSAWEAWIERQMAKKK